MYESESDKVRIENNSTVQYSTAQYSTVQYSTAQHMPVQNRITDECGIT
jgi:hypothetical protein